MTRLSLISLSVLSFFVLVQPATAGAQTPAPAPTADPRAFLSWSMDHYKSLPTFQAEMLWSMSTSPEGRVVQKRTIQYASPNRFKVVSANANGFVQTSVCDGKTLAEFSRPAATGEMKYGPPPSLDKAASMQMMHPMFCGTVLYQFFGGADALPTLVDVGKKTAPLRFGPDVKVDGESCKTVKFYAAAGLYGNVQIAIAPRDGLVRQIIYDSAPLLEQMRNQATREQGAASIPLATTTERYQKIQTDVTFADNAFDTTPPATMGATVAATQVSEGEKPSPSAIALGANAPEIATIPLAGGPPISLASLRGKVVLIDFWATWCGPCVRGLPETQALHKEFGDKGLAVLAVSDEDTKTIKTFLNDRGFGSLPVYRDEGGVAEKAYRVTAIPTLAVIDPQGRLSAYLVGLQQRETIRQALKKAGLEMPAQ
jgi:thiol-disulfide isomerase/thioredoxin